MSADLKPQPVASSSRRSTSVRLLPLMVKILGLGLAVGVAIALSPALIMQEQWAFLAVVWVIALVLLVTYGRSGGLPAKYLVPGGLLLVLFVVYPIILTGQLSLTNYGDGTRGTKELAISQIVGRSVTENPDSPRYNLSVGTEASTATGPFVFLLVSQATGEVFVGTEEGLEEAPDGVVVEDDFVTEAPGYTLLTPAEINDAGVELEELTVPTDAGAIRRQGIRQAFEGVTTLQYDESSDTITDTTTGTVYSVEQVGDRELFVDENGNAVSDQSWQAFVGLDNYQRIVTDERIRNDFVSIFIWTFIFATLSVVTNFALGLGLAITFNDPRMRGQKIYRALLILPYAIPGFISLLIWSSFFNRDFGLINDLLGTDINWFGDPTWAKVAVVITNLWMGFPYMFLVCTGALQAIPGELKEAASIDGASGFTGFRKITFPLVLVAVAPLLVATFAFNFNNYNAIELLTEGGPFSPANPTAGGTDILISYTIRLAFGSGGAEIGFASAVSVVLFLITGIIAAIQFRATRGLEDVN